jgi:murein DD-endopeptidase MepM/ murein hydrolase activator NlpD
MERKDDKIQIILLKDELANYIRFSISKKALRIVLTSFLIFIVGLTLYSTYAFFKIRNLSKNEQNLKSKLFQIETSLNNVKGKNKQLSKQVSILKEEREKTVKELARRIEIINELMRKVGLRVENRGEGGLAVPLSKIFDDDNVQISTKDILPQIDKLIKTFKHTPIGYPTYGRITSGFGLRVNPITGRLEFHLGVDIANRWGTPVRAPADGVVIKAGWCGLMGNCVEIYHGNGIKTYYGHLCRILVRKGDKVSRGEIIGLMGNTGRSTGPHYFNFCKCRTFFNSYKSKTSPSNRI